MNVKALVGRLAIILGSLILSLELYGLNFIKSLEFQALGQCKTYAMDYLFEAPMSLAVIITIAIIVYGAVLTIQSQKEYYKIKHKE